ncbi:putative fatty acyl-CoA reductase CG5065 [Ixodes scapularis]|uniref:putative fatty acyl-CoA reductase CG5065 n=1 Tax=Ixodes scapularis TaxID=6945 RepID=UPI001A9DCB57|nr:putative fatty acyl-CoA reductase CG5065 [Ixodes scapularis]
MGLCFKRLHEEYPESLNKVVGVEGNLTDEKLGLKSSDYKSLASEVSVVFHCAATVRFNDTLRNAVKINMDGTKSVLELCHNMKNMKVSSIRFVEKKNVLYGLVEMACLHNSKRRMSSYDTGRCN